MKKIILKATYVLLTLCLCLSAVGCQKNNQNEEQSISSEEAGMSADDKFKPSDFALEAKDEYVYEYLGLKFKLSDKFKKNMTDKKIAMLDDQSPVDKELNYAMLTFSQMTDEQKNAVINKMGDEYEKWQKELERVGTIGMFKKNMSEEKISEITNCDTTQIGRASCRERV